MPKGIAIKPRFLGFSVVFCFPPWGPCKTDLCRFVGLRPPLFCVCQLGYLLFPKRALLKNVGLQNARKNVTIRACKRSV